MTPTKAPMQPHRTRPPQPSAAARRSARAAACAVCGALALWCAAAAAETPSLTAEQHALIRSAKAAMREGAFDRAQRALDEALAVAPHPYVYRHLGALALRQGRCAEAKALLERAHLPSNAPYGRDHDEDARQDLLRTIAGGCPARLELTCPPGATAALDGEPVACNARVEVRPGEHVLTARLGDGRAALPRRIVTDGEALTTLRLDPDPTPGGPVAGRWTPTSPQPLPVQDPQGEAYRSGLTMSLVLVGMGTVFLGLGATGLGLTYSAGDPADDPDPTLTRDEQLDREVDYIGALSYSWMSVAVGGFLYGLAWALWPDAPPASDTPGFSEHAPRITLSPWLGPDQVGGGLNVTF